MESLFKSIGLDRYDRNARLRPAFLTLLPALIVIAVWFPQVWHVLTGLAALVVACGLMFLLSRLARYYGRMVQAKMVKHHGALHTTMILRHSDATLSGDTKARYHAFFRKMGFEIPTAEQEQADPGGADGKYSAAVDWLRQKTDDERKFRRLKDENIDFGFRRNLLGLKPIALVAALVALVMNSLMIWRHWPSEDHITIGAVLEALFIGASLLWLFVVRMPFVEDAARSYAVRLLAECDNLSPTPRRTRGPS